MAVSAPPPIPKQEYIHVLKTMDPCGQSDVINKFIEEAEAYETKTPLEETDQQSNPETLHCIENKIIELLQGILNGDIPLDIAFCRLIGILPYALRARRTSILFSIQCVAFFFYFVVGSCFPSVRKHIKSSCRADVRHSRLIQYLTDSYFPHVNDNRIKFKHMKQSSHIISSILEQYIDTRAIVPLNC
eukprot:983010_1